MNDKSASLTPNVRAVMLGKATEAPNTGEYCQYDKLGTYLCRNCGLALFRSGTKFHSACGWPSFDEEIAGAVSRLSDQDGCRTEIVCKRCQAHLGHVFSGEGFTPKNMRHCVNSVSLDFITDLKVNDTEEAIFAAGCFWGVEYLFQQLPGVLKTQVGYTGGQDENPSYNQVCSGKSGHYEAVRVVYDSQLLSYEKLAQYFFELHDFTQPDGQGPDRGSQYLSVAFYYNEAQKNKLLSIIKMLEEKSYHVATRVLPVDIFWPAEDYHQDYYTKTGKEPYCHRYEKKF